MLILRDYQTDQARRIYEAWNYARNILATAPTGSGKTVLFSHILHEHNGAAVAIAHRQELIGQISLSLARDGLRHSIIAPRNKVKLITQLHVEETGQSFYDPAAKIAVAGVKTLLSRADQFSAWCQQVTLWVGDEAHHFLKDNEWGRAVALFPNAKGLGVTATAVRADGKGLGRCADGVFDALVDGPTMRDLIDRGYLCDFKIFAPPSSLNLDHVAIGASGDFVHKHLVAEVRKSKLVGDVVEHYIKHAAGKRGITFTVDVESARQTAIEYMRAGVPAIAVSAKTPERQRHDAMRRFRRGELLQLVNCDLFGEGVDVPAVEVVSFARPTMSFPLYTQQFGRPLRPLDGKSHAIILDHVGNVQRHHGAPDRPQVWSLDRRPMCRRGERDPDIIPVKICVECARDFEAVHKICPYCQTPYAPERRDGPEFVDGDLVELDAATLAAMREAIRLVDRDPAMIFAGLREGGASYAAAGCASKNQRSRQSAQQSLRGLISLFGGVQISRGRPDSEGHKRFYFRYGVDVLSAQALGRPDAERLACKIIDDFGAGKI